jgi:hypothetical protein
LVGNDTVIVSALLGMNKLESMATSEELASLLMEQWTFDEPPKNKREESAGTMVLSSAGTHMIVLPPLERIRKSALVQARAPYSTYGEEHDNDVDYSGDSPCEEGSAALESPANSGTDQEKPNGNGKEEVDPGAILDMGAGTIIKRNAVLTQAIVLDLAATKQIKLHTSIFDTKQQAGLEEDIYSYDGLDGYTSPDGTIRMDKKLVTVVFIAVATETPNKLLLKARQEAYELVIKQAKDLLEKQRKSYEDQCARMAEEHQKCMERMKRESDKMLEEATKVRQEYAQAFLL